MTTTTNGNDGVVVTIVLLLSGLMNYMNDSFLSVCISLSLLCSSLFQTAFLVVFSYSFPWCRPET